MAVMHGWDVFAHQLLAQRLAAGGSVRLTVTTSSMAPFLLPGDGVMLAPVSAQSLRAGDIVALSALPQPIVHRVVAAPGWWGKGPLRTKGDAGSTYDRPLPAHTVLGRVAAVQRGDRVLPLTTRSSHIGALVLAKISCLCVSTAHLPSSIMRRTARFLLRQAIRITAVLLWRTYR
jgi:signal peptidase I